MDTLQAGGLPWLQTETGVWFWVLKHVKVAGVHPSWLIKSCVQTLRDAVGMQGHCREREEASEGATEGLQHSPLFFNGCTGFKESLTEMLSAASGPQRWWKPFLSPTQTPAASSSLRLLQHPISKETFIRGPSSFYTSPLTSALKPMFPLNSPVSWFRPACVTASTPDRPRSAAMMRWFVKIDLGWKRPPLKSATPRQGARPWPHYSTACLWRPGWRTCRKTRSSSSP